MMTKADKKAFYAVWRLLSKSKLKVKANMDRYRASPKGRESIRANTAKISEKRRAIAAEKAGFSIVKPGEFDGSAVQRTLNIWSGL